MRARERSEDARAHPRLRSTQTSSPLFSASYAVYTPNNTKHTMPRNNCSCVVGGPAGKAGLLWPGAVSTSCGRSRGQELWPGAVAKSWSCGKELCPKTVARSCGQEPWPEAMAKSGGQKMWRGAVARTCGQSSGHELQSKTMARSCGQKLWP